ncbi:MAG: FtsX-like permease family protein [Candidatus Shapirobacteria bacterium]
MLQWGPLTLKVLFSYFVFMVLLILYIFRGISRSVRMNRLMMALEKMMDKVDGKKEGDVSRVYLMELALRNLRAKKTRAVVTIGGVALGVAAIVFLVSLGYGLEKMVISKATRLDELRIIDVGAGEVASAKINQETINRVRRMKGVEGVAPMVAMVAKVRYQKSVADVMAYGVEAEYLDSVGAKIISGEKFQKRTLSVENQEGWIAGVEVESNDIKIGDKITSGLVGFQVGPEDQVGVWKDCQTQSEFLGVISRGEGEYVGEEVWGEFYNDNGGMGSKGRSIDGKNMGVWLRAKVPLWVEDGETFVPRLEGSRQLWSVGCLMETGVIFGSREMSGYKTLEDYLGGEAEKVVDANVLGVSTEASASSESKESLFETVVATDSSGVEWVELKKVGKVAEEEKLKFKNSVWGELYVSSAATRLWGLTKEEVVGKTLGVSFIVPDGLMSGAKGKLVSEEAEFKVAGVVDDEEAGYFYYQLADAMSLGVGNFSQLKVKLASKDNVAEVRNNIETLGLKTASTLDTVAEIEKLFGTLRILLGFLGAIALAVAALGMFNTMTVSLLERTREVGVMKAMGMLSDDVRELFLAESMIMGVGGGLLGLLLGWGGGKLLSLLLTSISVVKGQGVIDISSVPVFLAVFIVGLSVVVGILTGWYPSKRARQISALNALRYE